MEEPLFTGIAGEWYLKRLQRLYKTKPNCKYLLSTNHMLGICETCGPGRFAANNSRAKLIQIPLDRYYTVVMRGMEDVAHLRWVKKHWTSICTNVEFPIPTVQVRPTKWHTPKFISLEQKLVIDVLPKFNDRTLLISKVEEELLPAGFHYLVVDNKYEEVHRSMLDIQEDMCSRQFLSIVKSLMGKA